MVGVCCCCIHRAHERDVAIVLAGFSGGGQDYAVPWYRGLYAVVPRAGCTLYPQGMRGVPLEDAAVLVDGGGGAPCSGLPGQMDSILLTEI